MHIKLTGRTFQEQQANITFFRNFKLTEHTFSGTGKLTEHFYLVLMNCKQKAHTSHKLHAESPHFTGTVR
jgi:hypothetical protein